MKGMTKETFVNVEQILFATQPQVSVSVVVNQNVGSPVGNKTIAKAGTPIHGDLTARNTPFIKAADSSAPATGVLLHDVDLTNGNANGTLLLFGYVNLDRLDSTVAELITPTRKTELDGKVTFLK